MSSTGQVAPILAGQGTQSKGLPVRDPINLIPDELLQIILSFCDPQETFRINKRFLANTIPAFKSDQLQKIRATASFLAKHINLSELSPPKTYVPGALSREAAFRKMWNNAQKAIYEHIKQDPRSFATIKQAMLTCEEIVDAKDKAPLSMAVSLGEKTAFGQESLEKLSCSWNENYLLVGLFQGHGGKKVAEFANSIFVNELENQLEINPHNVAATLEKVVEAIHANIVQYNQLDDLGCTCVMTYIDRKKHLIYTATLGKGEAHLYRKINGEFKSIPLSCVRDWRSPKDAMRAAHRSNETEMVFRLPFEAETHVLQSEEFKGLDVSRGIGFKSEKGCDNQPLVIQKPKITVQHIEEGDTLLVTSGLRNFLTESEIIKEISNSTNKVKIAERLVASIHTQQLEKVKGEVTIFSVDLGAKSESNPNSAHKQLFNLRPIPPKPHIGPLNTQLRLADTLRSVNKALKEGAAFLASQIYVLGTEKLEKTKDLYTQFPDKPSQWNDLFDSALLALRLTTVNNLNAGSQKEGEFFNIVTEFGKKPYFGNTVKVTKSLLEKPWNHWSWFAIRKLVKQNMVVNSAIWQKGLTDAAKRSVISAFVQVGYFDEAVALANSNFKNPLYKENSLKDVFIELCKRGDLDRLITLMDFLPNQSQRERILFNAFVRIWHQMEEQDKQSVQNKRIEICYKLGKMLKTSENRLRAFSTIATEMKYPKVGSQNINLDSELSNLEKKYFSAPNRDIVVDSMEALELSDIRFILNPN